MRARRRGDEHGVHRRILENRLEVRADRNVGNPLQERGRARVVALAQHGQLELGPLDHVADEVRAPVAVADDRDPERRALVQLHRLEPAPCDVLPCGHGISRSKSWMASTTRSDFLVGHQWVERQRADLLGEPFGHRQAVRPEPELGVRVRPMDRDRVVDRRGDATLTEERAQRLALGRTGDEQVVDVVAGERRGRGQLEARVLEPGAERRADPPAVVVPAVEPPQLHAQQGGLERVQARRRPDHAVVVPRPLAVRPEQAHVAGELGVRS